MAKWKSNLCEHKNDCSICCLACLFPPGVAGFNAEVMEQNGLLWCVIYCVTGPFGGCVLRQQIRNYSKIKGNNCADCCLHCWCASCALRQEYTELKKGYNQQQMDAHTLSSNE